MENENPFVISQYGWIIPTTSAQINVAAVWKPFQEEVIDYRLLNLLAVNGCFHKHILI